MTLGNFTWVRAGVFVLASLLLASNDPALAQSIRGQAEAADGDSLSHSGILVRLFGIDAPEAGQTCTRDETQWACGADAHAKLAQLVEGKEVSWVSQGVDQYGRMAFDLPDRLTRSGTSNGGRRICDSAREVQRGLRRSRSKRQRAQARIAVLKSPSASHLARGRTAASGTAMTA